MPADRKSIGQFGISLVNDGSENEYLRLVHAKSNYGRRQADLLLCHRGKYLELFDGPARKSNNVDTDSQLATWLVHNNQDVIYRATIRSNFRDIFPRMSRQQALDAFEAAVRSGVVVKTASTADNPKALAYRLNDDWRQSGNNDHTPASALAGAPGDQAGGRRPQAAPPDPYRAASVHRKYDRRRKKSKSGQTNTNPKRSKK